MRKDVEVSERVSFYKHYQVDGLIGGLKCKKANIEKKIIEIVEVSITFVCNNNNNNDLIAYHNAGMLIGRGMYLYGMYIISIV